MKDETVVHLVKFPRKNEEQEPTNGDKWLLMTGQVKGDQSIAFVVVCDDDECCESDVSLTGGHHCQWTSVT